LPNKFLTFRVQWDITARCNLCCKHCELKSSPFTEDYLTLEKAKEIVDQFSKIAYSVDYRFSGGEPFFLPYFLDLIEYITRGNNSVSILTNGTLLTKKLSEELKKVGRGKIKYIRVSISGGDEASNDHIRGKGSFEKIITGIKNLVKAGFFVDIAYDCYRGNINEIEKAIKLAISLGAKRFGISFIQPKGRATTNFGKRDLVTFTNWKFEKMMFKLVKKYGDRIRINSIIQKTLERFKLNFRPTLCQLVLRNYLFINPVGEVYPCPEFYTVKNKEKYKVGQLPHDKLPQIINSPRLLFFKNLTFNKIPKCKTCKYLKFCEGGCRIEALKMYESIYAPDPHCRKIKLLYSKILGKTKYLQNFI
jgi:radical SAM protein with 4Fe4S-binding SPASM domain